MLTRKLNRTRSASYLVILFAAHTLTAQSASGTLNLPSGKQIQLPVPGDARRTNSLPSVLAVSPDGRYVAMVNTGYGTYESHYMQSIAVYDSTTHRLRDTRDQFAQAGMAQVLFSGVAFSRDGQRIYASMGSTTVPEGGADKHGQFATGNGIAVYGMQDFKLTNLYFIKIPLQQLAPGRVTREVDKNGGDKGVPFPAGIAVTSGADGSEQLVVTDNLSDDVVLLEVKTKKVIQRFDLSEADAVPSTYPVAVTVTADGSHAYVALWNASEIVELDLRTGKVVGKLPLLKPMNPTTAGSHPDALCLSPDGQTLYVALANRDAVAVVDVQAEKMSLRGLLDTRLPHQTYFGAIPQALALNGDGSRLYVADGGVNAVAVFDPARLTHSAASKGEVEPLGFIPTEWLPTALAVSGGKLYIAAGKGQGTGPNNMAQPQIPPALVDPTREVKSLYRSFTYAPTLLYGSLASVDASAIDAALPAWTTQVIANNRTHAAAEKIDFAHNGNSIRHVIYIIKENRTYDQIYGDLKQDGKQVGNGDPRLAMYGADITPNLHKLALQFGVLDNFYDSGEISGQGHVWSTAGIGSDYLEKTWPANYRSGQRTYDYEGLVAEGIPLQQKIADVNEPASGYLWSNLAAHGKSYLHFGEYISSTFCAVHKANKTGSNPMQGTETSTATGCKRPVIHPGDEIPEIYGGSVSKYPWDIPMLAGNTATKPELVGHFEADAPDFNLHVPDQFRVEVFLHRLAGWKADLAHGKDTMPQFILLRLPNDHTAGTSNGSPTPKASIADNDLAVGRAVEAISNSAFWDDTAFFILEDDAQNGADHVDAHRSTALIVSRYSPRNEQPFVDSSFYTTVSMLRTMEMVLGLPPMNNNDAFAAPMAKVFNGAGDQPPFKADFSNRDNGMIFTMNTVDDEGSRASSKMDFTHADRADARKLNVILWKDAMGDKPVPGMILIKPKKDKDDD